eukprot:gb/GEZN01020113.1/.p1 GENE.gb/GEZN01020113.1/~~gb/GEZN01020113.1/.p1  ORF type:complete len:207 (+),score=42.01 gb/GEZN01020113.1/:66-686(+)
MDKKNTKKTKTDDWTSEEGLDDDLTNFPYIGTVGLEALEEKGITRAGHIIASWYGACECDIDSLTQWMKDMGIDGNSAKQASLKVAQKYPKASEEALTAAVKSSKKTTIAEWVQSDGLLDEIKLFPGVGPAGVDQLKKLNVTRAGQLIEAWFDTCEMNEDKYVDWLKENGVAKSHASQCARAVAEKYPKLKRDAAVAKSASLQQKK